MNESPQTPAVAPVPYLLAIAEANKEVLDRAISEFQRRNGYLSDKRTLRVLFLATKSLLEAYASVPPDEISDEELRDVTQEAS